MNAARNRRCPGGHRTIFADCCSRGSGSGGDGRVFDMLCRCRRRIDSHARYLLCEIERGFRRSKAAIKVARQMLKQRTVERKRREITAVGAMPNHELWCGEDAVGGLQ